jgi:hypothetical protein
MRQSKWPDYLFTAAVRFVFGGIFGGLLGLLAGYRVMLRLEARDNLKGIVLWLMVWALIGSIVAVWTIPKWQTPWHKSLRIRDLGDDHSEIS